MKKSKAQVALESALNNESSANFQLIVAGFMEKGIPAEQITPRENVFTFKAWLALGRVVRKGEHGVKIPVVIPCEKKLAEPDSNGNPKKAKVKKVQTTTVFHISQTDVLEKKPVVASFYQAPQTLVA